MKHEGHQFPQHDLPALLYLYYLFVVCKSFFNSYYGRLQKLYKCLGQPRLGFAVNGKSGRTTDFLMTISVVLNDTGTVGCFLSTLVPSFRGSKISGFKAAAFTCSASKFPLLPSLLLWSDSMDMIINVILNLENEGCLINYYYYYYYFTVFVL